MQTEMSDLNKLYRILDIDVNKLSSKKSFSSNDQNSVLTPVHVSEQEPTLDKHKMHSLHVKKDVRFATHDDSSVIAYERHPTVDHNAIPPHKCSGCDNQSCDDCSVRHTNWSNLTHVYIGSITVIGLYALFRALQRSR